MNHDLPWEQMVQDADGSLDDFLADVNVGDLEDFDFDELDKHEALLRFDPTSLANNAEEQTFGSIENTHLPMHKRQRSVAHSRAPGWNEPPNSGLSMDYMPTDAAISLEQQQQQQQQQQHAHAMAKRQSQAHAQYGTIPRPSAVPPTPNSLDMHGRQPNYSMDDSSNTWRVYENQTWKQHDQMVFTPLVSPAVTPLDTQFQAPEYTVPGEYFTPLTSPAMQAQVQHQRSVYGSVRGSDTSEAASPSDMEIDPSPAPVHTSLSANAKGKKPTKPKNIPRQVRQSPAMKAQRKKPPTSGTIATRETLEVLEDIMEPISSGSSRPGSSSRPLTSKNPSSVSSSISPEPLSEILMPPPATPRSVSKGRSPNLGPQDITAPREAHNSPATPATLMQLQNSNLATHGTQSTSSGVSRSTPLLLPNLPNLRNLPPSSEGSKTPLASASANNGRSSVSSNGISVPPSPTVPVASSSNTPRVSAKGKKRAISTQPSPALRPKISPSIKPLLPEGSQSISAETSALLLASKSNYQNILEGNHLPGVTYPNALSVNLTSKRTSHKLAEQGRRNRMNSALQELATLLPAIPPSPNVTGKENAAATSGSQAGENQAARPASVPNNQASKDASSSKASTVEMAIEFIKALQGELGNVRGRLAVAEQALGQSVGHGAGVRQSSAIKEQGSDLEQTQDVGMQTAPGKEAGKVTQGKRQDDK